MLACTYPQTLGCAAAVWSPLDRTKDRSFEGIFAGSGHGTQPRLARHRRRDPAGVRVAPIELHVVGRLGPGLDTTERAVLDFQVTETLRCTTSRSLLERGVREVVETAVPEVVLRRREVAHIDKVRDSDQLHAIRAPRELDVLTERIAAVTVRACRDLGRRPHRELGRRGYVQDSANLVAQPLASIEQANTQSRLITFEADVLQPGTVGVVGQHSRSTCNPKED